MCAGGNVIRVVVIIVREPSSSYGTVYRPWAGIVINFSPPLEQVASSEQPNGRQGEPVHD